jgi:hypothetical protein
MTEKEKVTIVVFSGELDKALASFNIATTAASMGMDVTMFFTFWGLNVIKKNQGRLKSKGWMRKMLNWMNRGGSQSSWLVIPVWGSWAWRRMPLSRRWTALPGQLLSWVRPVRAR